MDQEMTEYIQTALLSWYDAHARILPWRKNPDPYRVWVSEIMLQQTRVETVLSYYNSFLSRFDSIGKLADAELEEVLKAWEGLGYYRRARMLWQGSREMMEKYGGMAPDYEALLGIRGIGEYTAGAVASIAYGERRAAVDGNAVRVFSRLIRLSEEADIGKGRRRIQEMAGQCVPAQRPGAFNQAVMDLGSMVCRPLHPDCGRCPLKEVCEGRLHGDAGLYPVLSKDKPKQEVPCTVFVLTSRGRVLMQKREKGLLADMWVYPVVEGRQMDAVEARTYIKERLHLPLREFREEGEARHVFTHRIWKMNIYSADVSDRALEGYAWVTAEELDALPVPTAMKAAQKRAWELLSRT